jgi:hypothetical protein
MGRWLEHELATLLGDHPRSIHHVAAVFHRQAR